MKNIAIFAAVMMFVVGVVTVNAVINDDITFSSQIKKHR